MDMKKLYYSIAEVSQIIGEEKHTIRYWEKNFSLARAKKTKTGRRVYTENNITVLQLIKKLIRNDKLTILGTQKFLQENLNKIHKVNTNKGDDTIIFTKEEFLELLETLQLLSLYIKNRNNHN